MHEATDETERHPFRAEGTVVIVALGDSIMAGNPDWGSSRTTRSVTTRSQSATVGTTACKV